MKPTPILGLAFLWVVCFFNDTLAAEFSFDALNRLTKAVYSNGLTIEYSYDDYGNRAGRTVINTARTIAVSVPNGGGSVSGGGLTNVVAVVSLQATPDSGHQFSYWKEGGSIIGYTNPFNFVVTASRELEAHFSALGSYAAFVSQFGLDPSTAGLANEDPDGDGLSNGVEFALGLNPTSPNRRAHTPSTTVLSGDVYPSATFTRRMSLDGMTLVPRFYVDLRRIVSIDPIEISVSNNGDGTETVVVRSSVPLSEQPNQYFFIDASSP